MRERLKIRIGISCGAGEFWAHVMLTMPKGMVLTKKIDEGFHSRAQAFDAGSKEARRLADVVVDFYGREKCLVFEGLPSL